MFNRKDGDILLNEKMKENLNHERIEQIRVEKYGKGIDNENIYKDLLELKTESRVIVYVNGYTCVEIRTKYNGTDRYVPSGLSTTKSTWWSLTLADENGNLIEGEGAILVPVEKIKNIIRQATLYRAKRVFITHKDTGDITECFLIPLEHIIPYFKAISTIGLNDELEARKIQ